MELEKFSYDNKIVKYFAIATVVFGIVGMLVGLTAAIQLFYPIFNFDLQYTTFGRIRPLHTNAVIFAFVGNAMFAGVYYSLQRLLKARMLSDALSWIHFWGWQLIIVAAAITLPLGFTSSKEYAELEWPIDIAIALIWVVFGINMIGTILKRRERHMYVAIWFYIATFVTVAVLHIFNSFAWPVSLFKSYSAFAGVQDALVQWWYGHNAVAFFLTTPFLGLMYYYLPKAANRPVYSYKLSIIHFWSLIFIYIWAGPHHLLYTSLPNWAQSLGVVFSIMLLAPSWGGMLNGLLTLRGAWDRVREDAVLKFMVVAVTAYGMSTFEGPMLSLKNVNAIAHFTDWIIAHVHIGGLGWNGFLTFGMLYWMIPRIYGTKLFSDKLANFHFWIGTLGIIFYALPLYWAGITQSLMWKQFTEDGFLQYPNFLETVTQIVPMYMLRAVGGLLYIIGVLVMAYNLVKTAYAGKLIANEPAEAPALEKREIVGGHWHAVLERKPIIFTSLALVAILIGGVIEFVPAFLIKSNVPTIASVKPYTPLELHGRDIYIREGCNTCHSQMVRPFREETERYGEYSKAGEFVYDHPFLWGSKRTGPDLHRVGAKYPDSWHFNHMLDPTSMSPGSIMPPYPWLFEQQVDADLTPAMISALRHVGVPYEEGFEDEANALMSKQAALIATNLKKDGIEIAPEAEIIALIAYLQRLGTDIKVKGVANQNVSSTQEGGN
ncbi:MULTISPECIES: cytochrome-c oxidase, cbb3-type subunit I [unclassified Imperialibacter]|uniref:cytochrome-c oxidase, cbb3-type subunit I n=1 Tax=unclassified Imperialibacter TaxID=2629706 RepID=UPI001258899E|nr:MULTISPECIES: cytochrome-c oxidase, cbb3-type subunit I [unclassified Imperialibacter]CAD5269905.1 Cytochrome C oxidase Cbb3 [Imperialibacter sp. 89]CAD5297886.1 Cytochrome C oxidase Cbb3 [Imperialibacter sp. 75]VVT34230.1 Cytochrome C oxidase Cbb3 [Imperialibacter sp. EC-SDR9]